MGARSTALESSARRIISATGTLVLVSTLALSACGEPTLTPAEVEESIANAQALIDAIDSHNSTFATYPETLEDLIPGFLETIPTDALGRPFDYTTTIPPAYEGSRYDTPYQIRFRTAKHATCLYLPAGNPTDGGAWWECSGSAEDY